MRCNRSARACDQVEKRCRASSSTRSLRSDLHDALTRRELSADAHPLPLADGSIDAVLCACVLCSVAQPPRALVELRRVLVPGGRLLLLEHVAAPPGHGVDRLQQLIQPLWGRATGGCSVRRDTRGAVAAAGFDITAVRTTMVWPNLPPVAPIVLGTAVNR